MGKDKYTNNEIVMQYEHYQVHDSEMYSSGRYAEVTQASSQDFFMTTGAKEAHAIFEIAVSAKAVAYLYEGVTINGNTVAAVNPTYNMKRSSTNTCTAYCGYGAGYSASTETLLKTILLPGTGGPGSIANIGAQARRNTEYVLKPSTRYMLRVTNLDTNTITAAVGVEFYEKTV